MAERLIYPVTDLDGYIGPEGDFGPRTIGQGFHTGIDLTATEGTEVKAAASGVVSRSFYHGGYGNQVVIEHGNGIATMYAHLSERQVTLGDQVVQGDVIGLVGNTGSYSLGAHLHWEVWDFSYPQGRKEVDPLAYMQYDLTIAAVDIEAPPPTTWPAGANAVEGAPVVGFGDTEPTVSTGLGPTVQDGSEPGPYPYSAPYQTAWWKFVPEETGWVSFDTHQSTTTKGEGIPDTVLGVYFGEPGALYAIMGEGSGTIPLDTEYSIDSQYGYVSTDWVKTAQAVVLLDAGRTYWIQVGLYSPDAEVDTTTYVLTTKRMIPHPVEIVAPVVGPFYNSPDTANLAVPTIVGGDDALRKDSDGYIEFPIQYNTNGTPKKSRYGGWLQGLQGQPGWPPPPQARLPGQTINLLGIQFSMRYYARRLDLHWASANADYQGNAGGVPRFSFGGDRGTLDPLVWDGTDWVQGESLTEGLLYHPRLSPSEEFLANGEYRTMKEGQDDPAMWLEWMGDWYTPPFTSPQHQTSLYALDPTDHYVWTAPIAGQRLSDGIEFAQKAWGMRIEWAEWVTRYITWTEVPTSPSGEVQMDISGQQVGERRRFKA
jgi:hypothetical protein